MAVIVPPYCRNELNILEIFFGTWPTISPVAFSTAMAYWSTTFPISHGQVSSYPTKHPVSSIYMETAYTKLNVKLHPQAGALLLEQSKDIHVF